jgi:hypothetical protein
MSTGLLALLQFYALKSSTPDMLAREAVSMAITLTMMDLAEASFLFPPSRGPVFHASAFCLFPALLQHTSVSLQNFRAQHSIC